MKLSISIVWVLLFTLVFQSCTLLAPTQIVKLDKPAADETYYVNNTQLDGTYKARVSKKKPFIVTRVKDGYKTDTQINIGKRFDGVALVTVATCWSVPYLAAIELLFPGGPTKHKRNVDVAEGPMVPLSESPMKEVYFSISNQFDTLAFKNAPVYHYKKYQGVDEPAYLKGNFNNTRSSTTANIRINNADELTGEVLEKMKAQPELADLIIPFDRVINLEVKFDEVAVVRVKHGSFEKTYAKVNFIMRDKYEIVRDSIQVNAHSVWYYDAYSSGNARYMYYTLMQDALSKFMDSYDLKDKIDVIKQKSESEISAFTPLQLQSSHVGNTLGTSVEAQVTLKAGDDIASGFLISNEGHFLTSFSNTRRDEDLRVVFSNGVSKPAKFLRGDPLTNVALMQVDSTGLTTLAPATSFNYKLGTPIYAVGSPIDESLSQSLTKGVISSIRKINGYDFIQTDTRSSFGNNGSPVLDKSGGLVGIMNNKFYFLSAQGLSVVVPIETALDRLKISIQ